MIASIGTTCLMLALPVSLYAAGMPLVAVQGRSQRQLQSGYRATMALAGLLVMASLLVIAGFLTNDFSIEYVASHSSTTLPAYYKFAGLWAGLDGSLLFWAAILSVLSALVVAIHPKHVFTPRINVVLTLILSFFVIMLLFAANPFNVLATPPAEGMGLNPQLQNFYMSIHPPCLYMGYIGMSVPFAIAMAALMTRRLDDEWIYMARRWMIVAWFFLTIGNILGMYWAYVELGWGGFWAWDPVENAAILPWFTATAYLHSVMVQERRGMLKIWNVTLISLTFLLTIFGTYLTRSGVVQSVHAFSNSTIGAYFLVLMLAIIVGSVYLIVTRLPLLKSKDDIHSLGSKEGIFLLSNIALVFGSLSILWSTMFPTMSEWFVGHRVELGPPFFNRMLAPFGLVLLLLIGIGPSLPWRTTKWSDYIRLFTKPTILMMVVGLSAFVAGLRDWYPLLTFMLVAFSLTAIVTEYINGVRPVMRALGCPWYKALLVLWQAQGRRFGGYIIHVGMLLVMIGFAGAVYHQEFMVNLSQNETYQVGPYRFVMNDLVYGVTPHYESMEAVITVHKGDSEIAVMKPARHLYKTFEQPSTEVDIHETVLEDVYLTLGNFDYQKKMAQIMVMVNPLVNFIWLGGVVIIFGTGIILMKRRAGGMTE